MDGHLKSLGCDHVRMTGFLAGYVVPAGAGLAGDPGLKAAHHSTAGAFAVPGGIEAYFREIKAAASNDERERIGERYGIRVVPD